VSSINHPSMSLLPTTAMVELDGDDVRISSRGKLAERDIVQVKPRPPHSPFCRLPREGPRMEAKEPVFWPHFCLGEPLPAMFGVPGL
jgi:hypothetical protein